MTKLTYDPTCKICRGVESAGKSVALLAIGVLIGSFVKPVGAQVLAAIIAFAASYLAFWIVKKTMPMTHHLLFKKDTLKKEQS